MNWAALIRIPAVRYCLALVALLALVAGLVWWHQSAASNAIQSALDGQRAELQRKAADVLASVQLANLETSNRASIALLELTYENIKLADQARVDAAASRGALQRLQHTLSALRRGGGPSPDGSPAISLADAAPALAASLSQCSERYAGLAEGFDRLSIQVTGLQAYINDVAGPVCLASE
jgi:hypothetical protein